MTTLVVMGTAALMACCDSLERTFVYPAKRYDHATLVQRISERYGPKAVILAPFDAIVVEPNSSAITTAIWFHGNGSVNIDFAALTPLFSNRGTRLVLAEYPGYGARPGTPSQQALVSDARVLYTTIAAHYPQQPIIVIGQSLGSGVAAQVASSVDEPPPTRLVLATPFFDLPDAASHAFWGLPLQSLVRDRYDSAAAIARYGGPVTIIVAGKDRLVGPESGRRLARVNRPYGKTELIELPDANHDDWLDAMSSSLWDALLATAAHP